MTQPEHNLDPTRRALIQLLATCALMHFSSAAQALSTSTQADDMTMQALIQTLRNTAKPVCLAQADRLQAIAPDAGSFDLHLRGAGLSGADVFALAAALETTTKPALKSFSISYNPGIGDTGATALIHALPTSVTELGMVGCDLGDASAQAILHWATQTPALRMICVEQNSFSATMHQQIIDLRSNNPGLFVVV